MRNKLWIALLVAAFLLTACGTAATPPALPTERGGQLLLALPRLVIQFDDNGTPSLLGLNLGALARLAGQDIDRFRLNSFYVRWLKATNVQHIEVRQTGDSLAPLVNGVPLPRLAMTDASLKLLAELLPVFGGQGLNTVGKILPNVRGLGADVVLSFPTAAEAKKIEISAAGSALAALKPSQDAARLVLQTEVVYDANGVPSWLGVPAVDLLPAGVNLRAALDPGLLKKLQEQNIQHVEIRTKPDGLYLYVNNEALPNILWDRATLGSAAALYAQMNPDSPYISLINDLVPNLDTADVGVLLKFPLASGKTAIPAKRH